jgi:NADPH-dependent curcumin reductase CurA
LKPDERLILENFQIRLKRRPLGMPVPDDFELVAAPMPGAGQGEILVRVLYLSVDPALRPRMNAVSPYAGPVEIGGMIPSSAIGVVIDSASPKFALGDFVFGFFGWQLFAAAPAQDVRRIDPALAPLPQWMSLLGLSSFTAYIGLLELGKPRASETVVVSAASGATGSVAGQLARIAGARAVGIAGGSDKCRYVVEQLGFDACVDYRAKDFAAQLDQACPKGIDVDYENVGGTVLRTVFDRMNQGGRVILCGLVSEYSQGAWPDGPSLWPAVYKSLRIEGFRASTHFHRIPEFVAKAVAWAAEGRLKHHEQVYEGIENAPLAFVSMLEGKHLGKVMVRVAQEAA